MVTYNIPHDPKMVHEAMCLAEGVTSRQDVGVNRDVGYLRIIRDLITECERKRPLGSNGKHGNLHTSECGCEDVMEEADGNCGNCGRNRLYLDASGLTICAACGSIQEHLLKQTKKDISEKVDLPRRIAGRCSNCGFYLLNLHENKAIVCEVCKTVQDLEYYLRDTIENFELIFGENIPEHLLKTTNQIRQERMEKEASEKSSHPFKEGGPADDPNLCQSCYGGRDTHPHDFVKFSDTFPQACAICRGSHIEVGNDTVNHPAHYNQYKGFEVIDLVEQMNFNRGNAVKYICRAGLKNPNTEVEDLEKARWYLDREINRLKEQPNA